MGRKITFDLGVSTDIPNVVNIAIQSKTDRQEVAIRKWRDAKGQGILHIVPRFGKTRIGIMVIEKFSAVNPDMVLVVVPSATVKKQWEQEIESFELTYPRKVTIMTKHEYQKGIGEYKLIIYDEIHKFVTTDIALKAFRADNDVKFRLGLTGTLPSDVGQYVDLLDELLVVDTIDETEAIANNWINDYDEYNIPLELSYYDKLNYVKYTEHINETMSLFAGAANIINTTVDNAHFAFKNDYDVIVSMVAGRKDWISNKYVIGNNLREFLSSAKGWKVDLDLTNQYDRSIEEYWSVTAILNRVRTFMDFVRKRKDLINKGSEKLSTISQIVTRTPIKETIIYVGNIDFADELREAINNILGNNTAICFHSRITSRPLIDVNTGEYFVYQSGKKKGLPKIFGMKLLKDKYIEGLRIGTYKILIVVDSLSEGLNVPNLKRTIMAAGSRNSVVYKQRAARSKTIDPNDADKHSDIINLYYDDFIIEETTYKSVDKQKLLLRQKDNESAPNFIYLNEFMVL